ncbi:MAG: hypothetical protein Q8P16_02775 [bacterium]|nr:hypothetical protein [bacterium]
MNNLEGRIGSIEEEPVSALSALQDDMITRINYTVRRGVAMSEETLKEWKEKFLKLSREKKSIRKSIQLPGIGSAQGEFFQSERERLLEYLLEYKKEAEKAQQTPTRTGQTYHYDGRFDVLVSMSTDALENPSVMITQVIAFLKDESTHSPPDTEDTLKERG